MSWTVTPYAEPSIPRLLSRYFEALGKALTLAQSFEGKCNHYLRVIKVTDAIKNEAAHEEIREIATDYRSRTIGRTLGDGIKDAPEVCESDVKILSDAKDSRNAIAHGDQHISEVHSVWPGKVYDCVLWMVPHVRKLARGDDLVSSWTYQVTENEPAPRGIQRKYEETVLTWVFGDLIREAQAFKQSNPKKEE